MNNESALSTLILIRFVKRDTYSPTNIGSLVDKPLDVKLLSVMNMYSCYNQIHMDPKDCAKRSS